MLPLTNAEKNLIMEMDEFCKNAISALERIAQGVEISINVLGNDSTSELKYLSLKLDCAQQLVSNFKISHDGDAVWILCKVFPETIYFRDSENKTVNAKNFMFALMSFENAFTEAINKIHHISKEPLSTLNDMQNVLHQIIKTYANAE